MKLINVETNTIKRSKFIAYFYEIDKIDDVNTILNNLKKEHKRATHFPYAYIIENNQKKSDDGEPGGTSGMPILKILMENNLNSHLIVVIRYYGGIQLGAGGLLRAYLNTASNAVKKS